MAPSRRVTIRHGSVVLHVDRCDVANVLALLAPQALKPDGGSLVAALAEASAHLISTASHLCPHAKVRSLRDVAFFCRNDLEKDDVKTDPGLEPGLLFVEALWARRGRGQVAPSCLIALLPRLCWQYRYPWRGQRRLLQR